MALLHIAEEPGSDAREVEKLRQAVLFEESGWFMYV